MDVTNYTNRLAQQRQRFNDAHNEQKTNYEREVSQLKERHETQLAKQTENHKKVQARLEAENRQAIEESSDKTKETLDAINKRYQAKMRAEQEIFEKERVETREHLTNRLRDIKDTYSTTLEQREREHEEKVKSISAQNLEQSRREKEGHGKALEDLNRRNEERFSNVNSNYLDSKRNIIEQNRQREQELSQSYADRDKKQTQLFREQLSSLREAQDQEVETIRKNVQSQNRRNSRDIEVEAKDHTDHYNRILNNEIDKRKAVYRDTLKEQQTEFSRDTSAIREAKAEEINDIRNSYRRSIAEEQARNQERQEQQAVSFDQRARRNSQEYEQNIKLTDARARDAMMKTKDDYTLKKNEIVKSHELERNQIVNEATLDRNQQIARQREEQQFVRNAHENETAVLQENLSSRLENAIAQKDNEMTSMRNSFERNSRETNDRNRKTIQDQQREVNVLLAKKEADNKQDIYNLRREYDEKLQTGSHVVRHEAEKQRLNESFDNKHKHTQNRIGEMKHANQLDRQRITELQSKEVSDQRRAYEKKIGEIEALSRDEQNKARANAREESSKLVGNYRNQLNMVKLESENQAINQRYDANRNLEQQRIDHARLVNELNDKNQMALSEAKDQFSKQRSSIIENSRQEKYEAKQDLRNELVGAFERKEMAYQQQLDNKQKELDRTVEVYENKLATLDRKSSQEVENLRKLENQRRSEDFALFKREQEILAATKDKEIMEQRRNYESRIEKLRNSANAQLGQMTNRYEEQMTNMTQEHNNTMNAKLREAETNYRKLHHHSQLEREAIVQQYETRLEKMRMAHQNANNIRAKRNDLA